MIIAICVTIYFGNILYKCTLDIFTPCYLQSGYRSLFNKYSFLSQEDRVFGLTLTNSHNIDFKEWSGGTGPRPFEPKEIDGHPGKASSLLTDHLITGLPFRSEHAKEKGFKSNQPRISLVGLVGMLYFKLFVNVMTS